MSGAERIAELEEDLVNYGDNLHACQVALEEKAERIAELEERLAIVMEMRDAICRQVDGILIRRNHRIEDLEEWIRNKRDSNFAFACKHLEGWTKDKDSFYAECTEILERK